MLNAVTKVLGVWLWGWKKVFYIQLEASGGVP